MVGECSTLSAHCLKAYASPKVLFIVSSIQGCLGQLSDLRRDILRQWRRGSSSVWLPRQMALLFWSLTLYNIFLGWSLPSRLKDKVLISSQVIAASLVCRSYLRSSPPSKLEGSKSIRNKSWKGLQLILCCQSDDIQFFLKTPSGWMIWYVGENLSPKSLPIISLPTNFIISVFDYLL